MKKKRIELFENYYLYVVKPHLYTFRPELYRTLIGDEIQKFLGRKNRLELCSAVSDIVQIHCRYKLTPKEQDELGRHLSFEKLSIRTEPHVWQFQDTIYRKLNNNKKFIEGIKEWIAQKISGLLPNSVRVEDGMIFFLTLKDSGKQRFDNILDGLPKFLSQFSHQAILCHLIERPDPMDTVYPFLPGSYGKYLKVSDPESDYIVLEVEE